jgi:hypothetical protein
VTEDDVERLRAGASRDDVVSMAALARALYATGLGPREVVRRCYGADFPEELFVIVEARLAGRAQPLIAWTKQPWELAYAPDPAAPMPTPGMLDDVERRIFARDPDLVPLGLVLDLHTRLYDDVLCYRLAELRAGRSTVFGLQREAVTAGTPELLGESLLAVLHEHHVDVLRWHEWKFGHPSNRGAGSIELGDVAEVRALLERVEELQREVAARGA